MAISLQQELMNVQYFSNLGSSICTDDAQVALHYHPISAFSAFNDEPKIWSFLKFNSCRRLVTIVVTFARCHQYSNSFVNIVCKHTKT